jgi:S-adenosylmethionine hydrolase
MTIITLLTDFGYRDGYPGVMKGVIWKIAPEVQIADISHAIKAQDIFQGAQVLARTAPYFPTGTIHVVVVDPGVGTSRRGIAARLGPQYFVGPDNGLLSMVLEKAIEDKEPIEFVHLDQPQYWLPKVSKVFHGRDVFAPVSAYLAEGIPLNALGTPITDPIRLEIPQPIRTPQGWIGQVIHIDHFGNLATNLHAFPFTQAKEVIIRIKGEKIVGLVSTFGERTPGTLVALFDSSGTLAISVVNGNAAQFLQASVGDKIEVLCHE